MNSLSAADVLVQRQNFKKWMNSKKKKNYGKILLINLIQIKKKYIYIYINFFY